MYTVTVALMLMPLPEHIKRPLSPSSEQHEGVNDIPPSYYGATTGGEP